MGSLKRMTSKASQHEGAGQTSNRFTPPVTPVSERLNQLTLHCPAQMRQAQWLRRTLEAHWGTDMPQPFIGFDEEERTFVAEWQSDTECNTLVIDANNHRGWYHPWPHPTALKLADALDLDTEDAWQLLRTALTTTRP